MLYLAKKSDWINTTRHRQMAQKPAIVRQHGNKFTC